MAMLGAHLVVLVIKCKQRLDGDELVVLGVLKQSQAGRQVRYQSQERFGFGEVTERVLVPWSGEIGSTLSY